MKKIDKIPNKEIYEKPKLLEISLLRETGRGFSEPPPPAPNRFPEGPWEGDLPPEREPYDWLFD